MDATKRPQSERNIPGGVVLIVVVLLNLAYAISHSFEPSVELLTALLLVGGFTGGRIIDVRVRRGSNE